MTLPANNVSSLSKAARFGLVKTLVTGFGAPSTVMAWLDQANAVL